MCMYVVCFNDLSLVVNKTKPKYTPVTVDRNLKIKRLNFNLLCVLQLCEVIYLLLRITICVGMHANVWIKIVRLKSITFL